MQAVVPIEIRRGSVASGQEQLQGLDRQPLWVAGRLEHDLQGRVGIVGQQSGDLVRRLLPPPVEIGRTEPEREGQRRGPGGRLPSVPVFELLDDRILSS